MAETEGHLLEPLELTLLAADKALSDAAHDDARLNVQEAIGWVRGVIQAIPMSPELDPCPSRFTVLVLRARGIAQKDIAALFGIEIEHVRYIEARARTTLNRDMTEAVCPTCGQARKEYK